MFGENFPLLAGKMAIGKTDFLWERQIWDLFEGRHLFGNIFDAEDRHEPFRHLTLMVALLGPPPIEFVRRSETTDQCFDTNGKQLCVQRLVGFVTCLLLLELTQCAKSRGLDFR